MRLGISLDTVNASTADLLKAQLVRFALQPNAISEQQQTIDSKKPLHVSMAPAGGFVGVLRAKGVTLCRTVTQTVASIVASPSPVAKLSIVQCDSRDERQAPALSHGERSAI